MGSRKDVIIRMPEVLARQLKIVAAHEEMTITNFYLQAGDLSPASGEELVEQGCEFVWMMELPVLYKE